MSQREAQELNYRIATEWFVKRDVDCGGVSLGDVMAYDVMRVVGGLLRQHGEKGDDRSIEDNNQDQRQS